MITVLPIDLELNGIRYTAGTEVDISEEVYQKVMNSVLSERTEQIEQFETVNKKRGRK